MIFKIWFNEINKIEIILEKKRDKEAIKSSDSCRNERMIINQFKKLKEKILIVQVEIKNSKLRMDFLLKDINYSLATVKYIFSVFSSSKSRLKHDQNFFWIFFFVSFFSLFPPLLANFEMEKKQKFNSLKKCITNLGRCNDVEGSNFF